MAELFIRSMVSPDEKTEINRPRRQIRHFFGSESVDRHQSVIDPVGVELHRFKATGGAVPWEHGLDPARGKLPVASSLEAGLDRYKGRSVLVGLTEFPDIDEFADKVWKLYADRRLRGWSLRFCPDYARIGAPTREEIRARPELAPLATAYQDSDGKRGYIVRKCDLVEYSATVDPSNTDSTTIEVLRSIGAIGSLPSRQRAIEARTEEAFYRSAEKMVRELVEEIRLMKLLFERKRLEGLLASQAEREQAKLFYAKQQAGRR
jgi:hypothetical protein